MHELRPQRRVAGYTAALCTRPNEALGGWRAPARHWGEGYPPESRGAKTARRGSRSRVCRCVQVCVHRSSARISARCDSLAQAGACFHMVMTPGPAAGHEFLGCHMHALGVGGQFGAPYLHGSRLLSTPYSPHAGRPRPHPSVHISGPTHVYRLPERGGAQVETRSGGFWCVPDGLTAMLTTTQL